MSVQYLLRFDDLCPTMNHGKWRKYEELVERYGVRPIIAVVPDNRDPELAVCHHDPGFWDHMRQLQGKGWTIALHGCQHLPEAVGAGLVPLHDTNEFVGLPEGNQRMKLEAGLAILRGHGLEPAVWVAPRHGFDSVTLEVLKSLGIKIVSDGFALYPYTDDGMFWIPQQTWKPQAKLIGVWTICLHTNMEGEHRFAQLTTFLKTHSHRFTSVPQVRATYLGRECSAMDKVFKTIWLGRHRCLRVSSRVTRIIGLTR